MALRIVNCTAQVPDTIVVFFSDDVVADSPTNTASAINPGNYTLKAVDPSSGAPHFVIGGVTYDQGQQAATLTLSLPSNTASAASTGDEIATGMWIEVQVINGTIQAVGSGAKIQNGGTGNNTFYVHVNGIGDPARSIAADTSKIAGAVDTTSKAVQDIGTFSLLTEEIGYAPSPLAAPSARTGAASAGGSLGQVAMNAISDVLGWKLKPADPKGFLGALTASFTCTEMEGHTECKWVPRTYAVQSDLSGGISGAQASLYSRAQDALEQSLPLLDGLYSLDPEADEQDVEALKAVVQSQATELVNELGVPGGPRVSRVNQFFALLLGQQLPSTTPLPSGFSLTTNPDLIQGSLGNLRDELGLSTGDDLVNTVEEEQDLTNFRILSDYVTSLAQSWLNNLGFFARPTPGGTQPFFGTQLVLLSRQLSVASESVDEVRFALDSVFIGPSERQTLTITFPSSVTLPSPRPTPSPGDTFLNDNKVSAEQLFVEELLSWVQRFASDEGPRLIQEGGKFGVRSSFLPVVTNVRNLVLGATQMNAADFQSMPRGYQTARVQRALVELATQLDELAKLADPIAHVIAPEPPAQPLAVLAVNPTTVSAPPTGPATVTVTIMGTGFGSRAVADFEADITVSKTTFLSQNLLVATLDLSGASKRVHSVKVTNPDGQFNALSGAFEVK
jgi:hypothetical protein